MWFSLKLYSPKGLTFMVLVFETFLAPSFLNAISCLFVVIGWNNPLTLYLTGFSQFVYRIYLTEHLFYRIS